MQHNVKHNVTVANRVIKVIGDPTIVSDNVNVDRLTAKFDSAWDGLDAISVFFSNGDTVIRQQYSDGMPIPWEVLTETGTVLLTFNGYHGEDEVIVTKQMKAGFIVEMSGISEGGEEPSEASPTEVQQIYNDIRGIREDIEAGMVKGEPGEPGAPGQDGSDYVITEDDYRAIADVVLDEIQPLTGRLGTNEGYVTPSMVYQALQEGRPISVTDKHRSLGDVTFNSAAYADDFKAITLHAISQDPTGGAGLWLYSVSALVNEGGWGDMTIAPFGVSAGSDEDGVSDVQINGTSITVDGVANIPIAGSSVPGVVMISGGGLSRNGTTGWLRIEKATNGYITARVDYSPIVPANLDFAVKAAMTDGKGAAWTDAEKKAALLRMGCTVDENGFVKFGS